MTLTDTQLVLLAALRPDLPLRFAAASLCQPVAFVIAAMLVPCRVCSPLCVAAWISRPARLGNRIHRGSRLSGAAMMVRPPRVPVDLQAQTRFVKERVERAIAELEQIVQQTDPVFVSPRDVTLNLWLAEREIVNAYIAMKSAWWP